MNSKRTLQRINNTSFVTWLLLVMTVLVFLLEIISGGSQNQQVLFNLGAKVNDLVRQGDWWRLITPIFLHIGFMHIAVNGVMIYYVGTQLERIFGHLRFLLIYFVSGIAGNLTSFAFGNDGTISAGASTALFGLFGAFIALGLVFKQNPFIQAVARQFGVLVIINLVFDLFMPSIDLWGHIGGFVGGLLIAFAINVPKSIGKIPYWQQVLAIIIVVGLGSLMYWNGMYG
ncbi:rhomboid family intramembrane serine protease [Agrilactobacillus fermenti]|uniref:rhomboid family intramembrane serine protease n=1 Tax=Agrilactobacillus fermenti TaxID=2586909 RepID=UPI003A5BD33F